MRIKTLSEKPLRIAACNTWQDFCTGVYTGGRIGGGIKLFNSDRRFDIAASAAPFTFIRLYRRQLVN